MFGMPEVAVIIVVVLIIFGPGKLPDLGSALGKGLKGLRKATAEERVSETTAEAQTVQAAKTKQLRGRATSFD